MTVGPRIVAIDLGNSAAKFCWNSSRHNSSTELVKQSFALTNPNWACDGIRTVAERLGDEPIEWRIASVNTVGTAELSACIDRLRGKDLVHDSNSAASQGHLRDTLRTVTRHDVPMKSLVDAPERLGIDRLVGAWAASRHHTGPIAVVDAGSAVTVDWVTTAGEFAGGAILPGLKLQSRVLSAGTDALPDVDWNSGRDRFCQNAPKNVGHSDEDCTGIAPATNTTDAIRLGVLVGLAGAIDRLIDGYASQHASPDDQLPTVVMTGGDAVSICPYLKNRHNHAPHLVCEGVLNLPPSHSQAGRVK